MKIKKEASGWYKTTFNGVKYDIIKKEDPSREWEIRYDNNDHDNWICTVDTLNDAKLLIANSFDYDKAFGSY